MDTTKMITSDILIGLMPNIENVDEWVEALAKVTTTYDIEAGPRLNMFLAQTMYESEYYSEIVENLNYSASGLLAVFKNYFSSMEQASQYARQPEKIGAHVYANRMGNDDEASGDGWTYRGRGLIQLTGKANYMAFATAINMALPDALAYAETPEGAAMAAGWFWNNNNLNDLADSDEFTKLTQKINAGLTGLPERKVIWAKVQTALA